ncbi:hypothetical protein DL96DRAFT_1498914 [Flagelloscypha sp. PMI_526]|nr:hypothetical protein DL96DRAFT_1498914 [Flagelloscypha sp. PMI_526]
MPSITGRGYVFIGLNFIRTLSIVSILLVFSSTIFVMVTNIKAVNAFEIALRNNSTEIEEMEECDYIMGSTVPHQAAGVFWSVVSSLFLLFQSVVLLLSEVEWPISFFDQYFPVLGSGFGLGALGVFQCLMGAQILSHHVDQFTLVAAFFIFALGCVNMLLGLVFREGAKRKRSISSFKEDSRSILPTINHMDSRPDISKPTPQFLSSMLTGSTQSYTRESSASEVMSEKSGMGFGRQAEKAAGLRGFFLQKPEESLPRYAAPAPAATFPPPGLSERPDTPEPAESIAPRTKSLRTTTSSFESPYRKSCQTYNTKSVYSQGDGESMYAPATPPPVPEMPIPTYMQTYRDAPPSFKSSKTSV